MKKYLLLAVVIVLFTGVSGFSQDNPSDRVEEEDVNTVNSVEQLSPDDVEGVTSESKPTQEELQNDRLEPVHREKTNPETVETDVPADTNPEAEKNSKSDNRIESKMDMEE